MKFEGTTTYVATDDLRIAVNAAVTLRRPLLVKGEPGTGKTILAAEVAGALGLQLIECTSNRPPRPSTAFMNTMPSRGCAIHSSAMAASTTFPIISCAASYGRRSRPRGRRC